ncbi:MAG TPA: hypothetical protein VFR31_01595, partial [Thermoanaerobaculia bacterium]|nr:hypothetical protein [Thermoanaerobaculia bacterium]
MRPPSLALAFLAVVAASEPADESLLSTVLAIADSVSVPRLAADVLGVHQDTGIASLEPGHES